MISNAKPEKNMKGLPHVFLARPAFAGIILLLAACQTVETPKVEAASPQKAACMTVEDIVAANVDLPLVDQVLKMRPDWSRKYLEIGGGASEWIEEAGFIVFVILRDKRVAVFVMDKNGCAFKTAQTHLDAVLQITEQIEKAFPASFLKPKEYCFNCREA
jgi:hypothetical protein